MLNREELPKEIRLPWRKVLKTKPSPKSVKLKRQPKLESGSFFFLHLNSIFSKIWNSLFYFLAVFSIMAICIEQNNIISIFTIVCPIINFFSIWYELIKSRGYKVVTPVVVTNADEFKSILATNYGLVTRNNEIIKIYSDENLSCREKAILLTCMK